MGTFRVCSQCGLAIRPHHVSVAELNMPTITPIPDQVDPFQPTPTEEALRRLRVEHARLWARHDSMEREVRRVREMQRSLRSLHVQLTRLLEDWK
jgi:hypothetical protein